jgi:phenylpyruvate tautomerase PptA (4-oxalocrotonate tautomerase family)
MPTQAGSVCSSAEAQKSKMDVAKEVLDGVLDKLHANDSLGVVLFRQVARLVACSAGYML